MIQTLPSSSNPQNIEGTRMENTLKPKSLPHAASDRG